jgi:hypothetical protein
MQHAFWPARSRQFLRACLEIAILRVIDEKGTAPSPCCVLQTRTEPHPWMGQNIPAI